MELLRVFTAGNVDDGKSTLIGRLLFDSKAISTDIIETLTKQSKLNSTDNSINLALLTDGLKAEREQGITIDVAYKFFRTKHRKFIVADTPGHVQYTRNMFTGASTANTSIILIDAKNGLFEQSKRHIIISTLLGISNIIVCINKIDLVDFSEDVFNVIKEDVLKFTQKLNVKSIVFIPVSAFYGDNVVRRSERTQWYKGSTLLEVLENIRIIPNEEQVARMQVQCVLLNENHADSEVERGYAGKLFSGYLEKNQRVVVLPSGVQTKIRKISKFNTEVERATSKDPIVVYLSDNVDVGRGSSIVSEDSIPLIGKEFSATICWMDEESYLPGQRLILQQNSFQVNAIIRKIFYKMDVNTFEEVSTNEIKLNDICRVSIKLSNELPYDSYFKNEAYGSFILISENTNNTVAGGVIE